MDTDDLKVMSVRQFVADGAVLEAHPAAHTVAEAEFCSEAISGC